MIAASTGGNLPQSTIAGIFDRHESELLNEWIRRQKESLATRLDLLPEPELRADSRQLLSALRETVATGADLNIAGAAWAKLRDLLADLSRRRAIQGFSTSETATFIFSLKQPLFDRILMTFGDDTKQIADQIWFASTLLDKLGLYTTEVFQKSREDVISRQQMEMLELSTPVVELWQGVLAVPLIGTLDSNRTQIV